MEFVQAALTEKDEPIVKFVIRDAEGNDVTDQYVVGPVTALVTNDGHTWEVAEDDEGDE